MKRFSWAWGITGGIAGLAVGALAVHYWPLQIDRTSNATPYIFLVDGSASMKDPASFIHDQMGNVREWIESQDVAERHEKWNRDSFLGATALDQLTLGLTTEASETCSFITDSNERERVQVAILLDALKRQDASHALDDVGRGKAGPLTSQVLAKTAARLLDDSSGKTESNVHSALLLAERIESPILRATAMRDVARAQQHIGLRAEAGETLREVVRLLRTAPQVSNDPNREVAARAGANGFAESQGQRDEALNRSPKRGKEQRQKRAEEDEKSSNSLRTLLASLTLGMLGFLAGGILRPVLEAAGRVFVGRAMAEAIGNADFAKAVGASPREPLSFGETHDTHSDRGKKGPSGPPSERTAHSVGDRSRPD